MKARSVTRRPVRRRRALTVAGATAAAVLPWIAARATGVELEVATGGQPPMVIGLAVVVAAALAASLAGWGTLALLERLTSRARPIWIAVAVTVLLASFAPLLVAEAATGALAYLALMHIAVGAVLIPGLPARGAAG